MYASIGASSVPASRWERKTAINKRWNGMDYRTMHRTDYWQLIACVAEYLESSKLGMECIIASILILNLNLNLILNRKYF